jgi:hypothetical protein
VRREIVTARSGEPTLLIDGVSVHSRYDPRREAIRYLDSLGERVLHASVVILIGEGLPYLCPPLRDRLSRARVLSIRVGPAGADGDDHEIDLVGASPGDIRRWLRERVAPLDAGGIELVLWEPGRKAVPDLFRIAEEEVLLAVRDLQAQIATIGAFGRRWITNAIRSAIAADVRWNVGPSGDDASPEAVSIVTSGPGLEPLLSRARPGGGQNPASDTPPFPGVVMATSSALSSLRHAGVDPDLVIHTDGGFWAGRYLREAAPAAATTPLLLALPARAAIPYRRLHGTGSAGVDPVFLATGWIGDQLHDDYLRWPRVTESPTVTGTLLSFARQVVPGATLCVSGLDLCSRGLLGHARPHLNDRFIAASARRLGSEATQRARRVLQGDVRRVEWSDGVIGWQSGALETFETVISSFLAASDSTGRVVPLYREGVYPPIWHARIEHRESICADLRRRRNETGLPVEKVPRASRSDRVRHLRATLSRWREAVSATEWDETTRELAFHLAPVEVLRARERSSALPGLPDDGGGGSRSAGAARAAAMEGLAALASLVERLHG